MLSEIYTVWMASIIAPSGARGGIMPNVSANTGDANARIIQWMRIYTLSDDVGYHRRPSHRQVEGDASNRPRFLHKFGFNLI